MQSDSENPKNLLNRAMEYFEAEGVTIVVDGARLRVRRSSKESLRGIKLINV